MIPILNILLLLHNRCSCKS